MQANAPVQITFTTVPIVGSNVPVTGSGPFVVAGADELGTNRVPLTTQQGALFIVASGTLPVTGTVGMTFPAFLSVTGTVTVQSFPALQQVAGTVGAVVQNWPAVIGVSASAPIRTWDGGTQGVSGTVSVTNFPATQAVSGTVTIGSYSAGVTGSTYITSTGTLPVAVVGTVPVSVQSMPGVNIFSSNPLQVFTVAPVGVSGTVSIAYQAGVTGSMLVSTTGTAGLLVGAPPYAPVYVAMSGNVPVVPGDGGPNFPVAVQGQVSVSNYPATQAVSGTVGAVIQNWPATIGVSSSVGAWRTWDGGTQGVSGTVSIAYQAGVTGSTFVTTTGSMGMQVGNAPYDPLWMTVTGSFPVVIASGSVATVDGSKATYSAAIVGLVAANTATDIFTITGAASKVIRVTRISLTATQTTANQRDVLIIKRSSANTGGTSATVTAVPHDSLLAPAAASVKSYTANPTALGTTVGNMATRKVFLGTVTTGNSDEMIIDFGTRNCMAVVLRGTGETLAINLNSVTSTGNSFDIKVEWTEE